MSYSNAYIIYPINRALEKSVAGAIGLLPESMAGSVARDGSVTIADIFFHARGNYEQKTFNANILEPLSEAIEATLTDQLKAEDALSWADKQNRLGNVCAALGQKMFSVEHYEKALACFDQALTVYSQEETPAEWALTQYNIGTAKQALGRQESLGKVLNEAVDAYINALLVWNKQDNLEEWMLTMHQLGVTYHQHGLALKGNRTFQKAVVAHKNALSVLNADDYALELTATHNNRAVVLQHLAESENNPDRVEEALRAYEKGLAVCMEQQLPFHLAVMIRINKATAQLVLAGMSKNAALAEEVADEYELILECFPHALQPLSKKHCQAQEEMARKLAEELAA